MPQLFLSLLLFSSLTYAQSIAPGLWQADTTFKLNNIPMPGSKAEECVSAQDAKDIKSAIVKELASKGCEITKWTAKAKKLEASLKCNKSGLDATGNLHGSFSDKSYDLSGEAEGTYQGFPSEATITLKGKWLKVCKK